VGSGLKHVAGSRPIVETPGKTRPQRPAGPTVIKKPGVPKVPHTPGEPQPVPPPKPVRREPKPVENASVVDESQLTAEQLAAIPTANPVFLQGVVSLILIGVLVIVGATSVYLGVQVFSKPSAESDTAYLPGEEPEKVEEQPNPFLVSRSGPKVCGVSIAGPVAYLIDGGDAMGDLYLYSRDAMRASVLSLPESYSFGVVIAGEEKPIYVGNKQYSGGATGEKLIQPLLRSNYDGDSENPLIEIVGASDLYRGVEEALLLKPKTLVMFVRNTEIFNPGDMGKSIASSRVRLVLVAFGYEYEEQKKSYEMLVQAAGGESRLVLYDTDRELQSYYDERNLPE
jgi:hypothetical protein